MPAEPRSFHLSFDEAAEVAEHLARVWRGMLGTSEVPNADRIADMFQVGLRKSREVVAAREGAQ